MAKRKLDFTGIETRKLAPEGTHIAKIATVEEVVFQSGNEGFKIAFDIVQGPGKGARVFDNYPLIDESLWKLKALLESIRIPCEGRILLDTNKMIGKRLQIDVIHEEYEGKPQPRIQSVDRLVADGKDSEEDMLDDYVEDETAVEAEAEPEEEEEKETKQKKSTKKKDTKKSSKKSKKKEKEEEPEEDEIEDDLADEDEEPKKKKSSKKKEKDDDDWEDDDDESLDDWDDWGDED